ncbi:MAG: hypothetical protein M0D57_02565 [Sphingobacteriales bacterium JAD_PAG50586_3]|nr:MAG: hypothetical protein M0D57_02565 [Sphingobacteriales bacterium JAD_PAG50586_3]
METQKAYTLHEEHKIWLNKLDFYADDIMIQEKCLQEVVAKNTDKEVLAMAHHFENQFIMRKEQIDELRHSIKEHELFIANKISHNPAADHVDMNDHPKERDTIETFEKSFAESRTEFVGFLSKVM